MQLGGSLIFRLVSVLSTTLFEGWNYVLVCRLCTITLEKNGPKLETLTKTFLGSWTRIIHLSFRLDTFSNRQRCNGLMNKALIWTFEQSFVSVTNSDKLKNISFGNTVFYFLGRPWHDCECPSTSFRRSGKCWLGWQTRLLGFRVAKSGKNLPMRILH